MAQCLFVCWPGDRCAPQSKLLVCHQSWCHHYPCLVTWLSSVSLSIYGFLLVRTEGQSSSANFYYLNRGVWVLIMAQLSTSLDVLGAISADQTYQLWRHIRQVANLGQLARIETDFVQGDTTSAFIARLVSSFWGCVFGMVSWYVP